MHSIATEASPRSFVGGGDGFIGTQIHLRRTYTHYIHAYPRMYMTEVGFPSIFLFRLRAFAALGLRLKYCSEWHNGVIWSGLKTIPLPIGFSNNAIYPFTSASHGINILITKKIGINRVYGANKSIAELVTKMLNSLRPDFCQSRSKPSPTRCQPLKMCTVHSSLLPLKLTRLRHKFSISK